MNSAMGWIRKITSGKDECKTRAVLDNPAPPLTSRPPEPTLLLDDDVSSVTDVVGFPKYIIMWTGIYKWNKPKKYSQ